MHPVMFLKAESKGIPLDTAEDIFIIDTILYLSIKYSIILKGPGGPPFKVGLYVSVYRLTLNLKSIYLQHNLTATRIPATT